MNVLNENTFSFFNNKSNLNYFGDWINNIDYYKQKFNTKLEGLENKFVVIDNFLNDNIVNKIADTFPDDYTNKNWFYYENPLEVKY